MSSDSCNSRSLSWLLTPCIPKSPSDQPHFPTQTRKEKQPELDSVDRDPPIHSLPDDLLLACFARAPFSSLPPLSRASRRFSLLLSSPHFFLLRRSLSHPTLFSLSLSSSTSSLLIAALSSSATWRITSLPPNLPISHPAFVSLDNIIFIIGRDSALKYDTWTDRISPISPPLFPRKKFAAAAVNGKILIAGGSSRTSAVEIYDPESDTWRMAAAESAARRYGCVGAAAGESFFVAGGLMLVGGAAHVTAGTVEVWNGKQHVRSARVPGGGCIVGACGVGGSLHVIASNAVEVTLWRLGEGGREWVRLVGPPVEGRVGVGGAAVRFSCCC